MKTKERANAAYILSDDITKMQIKLERAEVMLHEVTEEYFGRYCPGEKSGQISILLEYSRNGLFAGIAGDYLHEIRKELEQLAALVRPSAERRAEQREAENKLNNEPLSSSGQRERFVQPKIELTLMQDAYHAGHDDAFLRERDANGTELPTGLYNDWCEAAAEDETGAAYTVYWEVFNGDVEDWSKPYMVLDEHGQNVKENVILV